MSNGRLRIRAAFAWFWGLALVKENGWLWPSSLLWTTTTKSAASALRGVVPFRQPLKSLHRSLSELTVEPLRPQCLPRSGVSCLPAHCGGICLMRPHELHSHELMLTWVISDDESDESSSDESIDVPVATRRKFGDEEDSDDVRLSHRPAERAGR